MVKFCHFATKAARCTEFCLMSCHCLNLAPWPYQRQSSLQCQFTPPACFKPLSEAVVDSGTSLLAVPTPIFPELYEMLRHGVTKVFGEIGWNGFLSTLPRSLQFKSGSRLVQAVLSLVATYYIAAWLDAVLQVSCITWRGVFIVWTFVPTAVSRLGSSFCLLITLHVTCFCLCSLTLWLAFHEFQSAASKAQSPPTNRIGRLHSRVGWRGPCRWRCTGCMSSSQMTSLVNSFGRILAGWTKSQRQLLLNGDVHIPLQRTFTVSILVRIWQPFRHSSNSWLCQNILRPHIVALKHLMLGGFEPQMVDPNCFSFWFRILCFRSVFVFSHSFMDSPRYLLISSEIEEKVMRP